MWGVPGQLAAGRPRFIARVGSASALSSGLCTPSLHACHIFSQPLLPLPLLSLLLSLPLLSLLLPLPLLPLLLPLPLHCRCPPHCLTVPGAQGSGHRAARHGVPAGTTHISPHTQQSRFMTPHVGGSRPTAVAISSAR